MNFLLQNSDLNLKAGKTTRSFRYDLNQIPYDYTVKVIKRFKGLDLTVPEELWEVCNTVQEAVIKTIAKKKNCKKAKWLSKEVFGEGNGTPRQYSSLENSMDRETWAGYSPWGHKESDMTEHISTCLFLI